MGYNNSVAIISNSEQTTRLIREMLVLLREIDRVDCFDYYDTDALFSEVFPSVIILHAQENDKNAIKLLKKIRQNPAATDVSIILYPEYENTDYIVKAFDEGVTDILTPPLKDYELVIRVIWAIQKGEVVLANQTKDNFLVKLGIVDEKTGFYKSEYSMKYLESVVELADKNRLNSCIMLIKPLSNIKQETVIKNISNAVRTNDTVVSAENSLYYIFLLGAKNSGLYSIYERIAADFESEIKGCATEVGSETFENVIEALNLVFNNSDFKNGFKLVSVEDFIAVRKNKEQKLPEFSEFLDEITEPKEEKKYGLKVIQEKFKNFGKHEKKRPIFKRKRFDKEKFKEAFENIRNQENETVLEEVAHENDSLPIEDYDIDLSEFTSKEPASKDFAANNIDLSLEPDSYQQGGINEADERVSGLYGQSYKKKLKLVVAPILNKYAAKLQSEFEFLDANVNVDYNSTFMYLEKDDIKLKLDITFDGTKTVRFDIAVIALGSEIESDLIKIDIMELDHEKLDIILKTLTDEYRNYLSA